MDEAEIHGPCIGPQALRHSYATTAIQRGMKLHKLKERLGHADIKTTVIYLDALSEEDHEIAELVWDGWAPSYALRLFASFTVNSPASRMKSLPRMDEIVAANCIIRNRV